MTLLASLLAVVVFLCAVRSDRTVSLQDLFAVIKLEPYAAVCIVDNGNWTHLDQEWQQMVTYVSHYRVTKSVLVGPLRKCPKSSLVIASLEDNIQEEMVSSDRTTIFLGLLSHIEVTFRSLPLKFSSKVFIPAGKYPNGTLIRYIEVYKIKPDMELIVEPCPNGFDPSQTVWNHRRNMRGIQLSIVYDLWTPYCIYDIGAKDPEFSGIFFDLIQVLSRSLNFTTSYVANPEPWIWGSRTSNGSFTGMIGQISRGNFDTSIAGFTRTYERNLGVDFVNTVAKSRMSMFVSSDGSRSQLTTAAFTSEFSAEVWAVYFAGSLLCLVVLWLILLATKPYGSRGVDAAVLAGTIVMRAMTGLRSVTKPLNVRLLSWQFGFFTVVLGEFVYLSIYRSQMNAVLTTQVEEVKVLPVSSFKDIYQTDYDLLVYKDSSMEEVLRLAPRGSYSWKLYEKLFVNQDPEKNARYAQGYAKSVQRLMTEEIVYFDSEESLMDFDEYKECKLSRLDDQPLPLIDITMPMQKDGPFTDVFNHEIDKMLERGAISRIIDKYTRNLKTIDTHCLPERFRQVSLGLNHVFFPFFILLAAIVFCSIFALHEFFKWSHRRPKLMSFSPDQKLAMAKLSRLRQALNCPEDPRDKLKRISKFLQEKQPSFEMHADSSSEETGIFSIEDPLPGDNVYSKP